MGNVLYSVAYYGLIVAVAVTIFGQVSRSIASGGTDVFEGLGVSGPLGQGGDKKHDGGAQDGRGDKDSSVGRKGRASSSAKGGTSQRLGRQAGVGDGRDNGEADEAEQIDATKELIDAEEAEMEDEHFLFDILKQLVYRCTITDHNHRVFRKVLQLEWDRKKIHDFQKELLLKIVDSRLEEQRKAEAKGGAVVKKSSALSFVVLRDWVDTKSEESLVAAVPDKPAAEQRAADESKGQTRSGGGDAAAGVDAKSDAGGADGDAKSAAERRAKRAEDDERRANDMFKQVDVQARALALEDERLAAKGEQEDATWNDILQQHLSADDDVDDRSARNATLTHTLDLLAESEQERMDILEQMTIETFKDRGSLKSDSLDSAEEFERKAFFETAAVLRTVARNLKKSNAHIGGESAALGGQADRVNGAATGIEDGARPGARGDVGVGDAMGAQQVVAGGGSDGDPGLGPRRGAVGADGSVLLSPIPKSAQGAANGDVSVQSVEDYLSPKAGIRSAPQTQNQADGKARRRPPPLSRTLLGLRKTMMTDGTEQTPIALRNCRDVANAGLAVGDGDRSSDEGVDNSGTEANLSGTATDLAPRGGRGLRQARASIDKGGPPDL